MLSPALSSSEYAPGPRFRHRTRFASRADLGRLRAPAFVAGDLGYYEEEGLSVDFRFEDDRSNVLAAMERGDIDADMRTVGEHQGRPRTDETPGTIIGTIDVSLGGDGVSSMTPSLRWPI